MERSLHADAPALPVRLASVLLATLLVLLAAFAPASPPLAGSALAAPTEGEARSLAYHQTARPDSSLSERLERAFGEGDAEAVMDEAASRLDVSVLGQGARYSRSQAAFVLQAFFREHPPAHATLATSGVAERARSLLGRYASEDETIFRLEVRLRLRGSRWEVVGIRIEQAKAGRQGGTR